MFLPGQGYGNGSAVCPRSSRVEEKQKCSLRRKRDDSPWGQSWSSGSSVASFCLLSISIAAWKNTTWGLRDLPCCVPNNGWVSHLFVFCRLLAARFLVPCKERKVRVTIYSFTFLLVHWKTAFRQHAAIPPPMKAAPFFLMLSSLPPRAKLFNPSHTTAKRDRITLLNSTNQRTDQQAQELQRSHPPPYWWNLTSKLILFQT